MTAAPGTRYERLTIIGPAPSRRGLRVVVECDCGKRKEVFLYRLVNGNTKSCGCRRADVMREAATASDHPRNKHGDAYSPLYKVWTGMKGRCANPNLPVYQWYGAKGVQVCEAWLDWATFKSWAQSSGYREGLTIDRIDSTGNYEPENCEWVTRTENTRRRLGVTGETCTQGHPFDEVNTYYPPSGGRQCRTCKRERKQRNKVQTIIQNVTGVKEK